VGSASLSGYSVHPATGNLYLSATDVLSVPAVGAPLVLVRSYNSRGNEGNVGFGKGWTHSYAWRVSEPQPNLARILRPDGRAIYFSHATRGWIAESGEFGTFNGSSANGYLYVDKLGTQYSFDSINHEGRLLSIQRAGAVVPTSVEYEGAGLRIHNVRSGYDFGNGRAGAKLTFEWKGDFIIAVVDQASNRWTYAYDSSRALLLRVAKPFVAGDGAQAETEYFYERACVEKTCFEAPKERPVITHVRVRQSKNTWIDAGFFGYESSDSVGLRVVNAASGYAGNVLQGLTSWRYKSGAGEAITSQTLNNGRTQLRVISRFVSTPSLLRIVAIEYMRPVRWRSDYIYNADTTLASYTDFRRTRTTYSRYDSKGNPGHIVVASGTPAERTTDYSYHPVLSTILSIVRQSLDGKSTHTTVFDYDADTDAVYNAAPTVNLHRIIETGKTDLRSAGVLSDTQTATTTFSYDTLNRLTSIDLSTGMHARYNYFDANADPNNRFRLRSTQLDGAKGKTLEWRNEVYDANGRLLVSSDPNLTQTIRAINAVGLVSERSYRRGDLAKSESYVYDASGATTMVMATPGGEQTAYEYDTGARLVRRVDFGPDRAPMRTEAYTYDKLSGKPIVVRRFSGGEASGGETCMPANSLADYTIWL